MARRILVVEDDPSMRELMEIHLRSAGYTVDLAADAIAAGYAVLKAAPDLIVCDVDMPHMNGFELVAALRADAAHAHLPVVFVTASNEGEDRARSLGVLAYLNKPLRLDELLTTVRKYLPPGG